MINKHEKCAHENFRGNFFFKIFELFFDASCILSLSLEKKQ